MKPSGRPALDHLAALTFRHRIPLSTIERIIRHEEKMRCVAAHEAGHAVAAVVFGGTLRSVVVADNLTGLTSVEPETFPTQYTAQIAYSGPWSQARAAAGRRPTMREMFALWDAGGQRDRDTLCAAGGTAAGADVVPLLERCWGAVAKVGDKLHMDSRVSHDDVLDALGLSRDLNTQGVELALIRSGSAPGSFRVSPPTLR